MGFEVGDKVTFDGGTFVYTLTAVGIYCALALNKNGTEVMLELSKLDYHQEPGEPC